MTPEERLWCLDGDLPGLTGLAFIGLEDGYHRAPFFGGVVERLGMPGIAFADGPRGSVLGNSTCFPVTMARGATWDVALEERVGQAIGVELRASGATLTGAVCVNLLRHPARGRAQETYGEDPHHVGELGAAFTRGLQRHVMACVKHFACNSMENARFKVDVEVDEVALHEVYLPHFRRIVDEGVAAVMTAYNMVNGEWCAENRELLTDILRDEWQFEGFVISDWVFGLRDAARSLDAGLDMEMPARLVRAHHLKGTLDRGEVTWSDVDLAVAHVVATLLRFEEVLSSKPDSDLIGSTAHRTLARDVASRSVVLLRNEKVGVNPVLPLDPGARIALVGRLAEVVNVGDHGSSDVWDLECRTVAEGFRGAATGVVVDDGGDLDRAADVAAAADVAVVVVGYTRLDEGEFMGDLDTLPTEVFPPDDEPDVVERFESWKLAVAPITRPPRLADAGFTFGAGGDRASLRLLDHDVELIRAVAAANPRTVVIIQSGSAVLCDEWIDDVPAVAMAWYGGAEAGPALVEVLTGAVEPSGRLPFSIPRDEADLPPFDRDADTITYERWLGWWRLARDGRPAAFPFGFGLAYTTFALDHVDVIANTDSTLRVRGVVRNTGARDGSDVVQVYADRPDGEEPGRLVGFARVDVPAHREASFSIAVPLDRLATRDPVARTWRPATGPHRIAVARHAGDPSAATTELQL
jgi:beta-glucosidase-like glycosyl hydrolase